MNTLLICGGTLVLLVILYLTVRPRIFGYEFTLLVRLLKYIDDMKARFRKSGNPRLINAAKRSDELQKRLRLK